jgi:hypothetical protein
VTDQRIVVQVAEQDHRAAQVEGPARVYPRRLFLRCQLAPLYAGSGDDLAADVPRVEALRQPLGCGVVERACPLDDGQLLVRLEAENVIAVGAEAARAMGRSRRRGTLRRRLVVEGCLALAVAQQVAHHHSPFAGRVVHGQRQSQAQQAAVRPPVEIVALDLHGVDHLDAQRCRTAQCLLLLIHEHGVDLNPDGVLRGRVIGVYQWRQELNAAERPGGAGEDAHLTGAETEGAAELLAVLVELLRATAAQSIINGSAVGG